MKLKLLPRRASKFFDYFFTKKVMPRGERRVPNNCLFGMKKLKVKYYVKHYNN